jgi:heat shock protein HslJ
MNMSCSTQKDNKTNSETEVNYPLAETYWKLIELNGQPVSTVENRREAFMILKKEGNSIHGNSSCNTFNGTYTLSNETQLSFSKMASTMMACMDMKIENELLEVLQRTDNFAVKGKILSLNRARMAPLAKFEAIHMK